MTRPRPKRGQAAPPPLTARALMAELDACWADYLRQERERALAERRDRRKA